MIRILHVEDSGPPGLAPCHGQDSILFIKCLCYSPDPCFCSAAATGTTLAAATVPAEKQGRCGFRKNQHTCVCHCIVIKPCMSTADPESSSTTSAKPQSQVDVCNAHVDNS